jgi:hypothetical protein
VDEERQFEDNAHDLRKQSFRAAHAGQDLKALVVDMYNVRQRKEAIEADLKNVNAEYDVLRFELIPEAMDKAGVENVRYEGIGRVSLTADIQVACPAPTRDDFFTWLRKHKLGSLISEGVNPSTLKSWIKTRMKEGKELPSELLKITPITRASITKG